jgi:hypothetical protein
MANESALQKPTVAFAQHVLPHGEQHGICRAGSASHKQHDTCENRFCLIDTPLEKTQGARDMGSMPLMPKEKAHALQHVASSPQGGSCSLMQVTWIVKKVHAYTCCNIFVLQYNILVLQYNILVLQYNILVRQYNILLLRTRHTHMTLYRVKDTQCRPSNNPTTQKQRLPRTRRTRRG